MKETQTWLYKRWHSIRERVKPRYWIARPGYAGVSLGEGFFTFQGFKEWAVRQVGYGQEWEIDKDILVRGNRIYSPETCLFVPNEINLMVNGSKGCRGALPIGVGRSRGSTRFKASCSIDGKLKCVYGFGTVEEAFAAYKEMKEAHIKRVAEKWRGQLDERAYAALMAWEVKITD